MDMQNQKVEHPNEESSLKKSTLAAILQALTDPALTRLDADDLSRAVLRCLREMMAADNLALLLLTEDHTALHIHTVLGVEEAVARDVSIPIGQGFAGQIITQGIPLRVYDPSLLEILTPILREQLRSLLGVPLIIHQHVIGVLHVGMKREYLFPDSDVALLEEVADSLAQAFERTLLIEAEQYEFEELIEAQLRALVKLVQVEQRAAMELAQAQQQMAGELIEVQKGIAIELVEMQQQTAGDLVEAQEQTAEDLAGAQRRVTGALEEAQRRVTGALEEAQYMEGEPVQIQQRMVIDLAEAQHQVTGDLVGVQQYMAGDLVEAQHQVATELVEAQHQVAIELVEAQHQVATELVEAQTSIRLKVFERMNELENVFNAIMDGVIVYDEQENIICSNQSAQHILGIETHPARLSNDSHPSWTTTYHLRNADGDPFSTEHLPLKRLLGGERLAAKNAVVVHFQTVDGRDILLSVTGAPLYTQVGHPYGAICVLRDVTTRKHMERRVEILDGLLQMVELLVKSSAHKEQESLQDDPGQIIQQIESNILALAQRLLGCSHAIIIGIHPSTQVLSPLALAGFSREQEERLRTHFTGAHLSLLITDPSKAALQESLSFTVTQSPLLLYLSPMNSSPNCHLVPIYINHHLIGLLGIMFPERGTLPTSSGSTVIPAISKLCGLALQYEQQATERHQLMATKILLNEQLEQVNKMQEDFISVVSHEFRTSLTTIEGFSDLLRSEDYLGEEVKEYANDIYADAIRLHEIVTNLLDIEQMKKGVMQLRAREIDLNMLLTTAAKHMALISARHTLRLSLDKHLPQLEGDPEKLIQVITNLLSNAIKYSPMGGEILITSTKEGESVHVSIQDHGIGIASHAIENIFTPYHRVNASSTHYIEGTSLGLSLVNEIVHLHEGKIWIESTPGHGSTFHLSLPLTRETVKESKKEIPLEAQAGESKNSGVD